MVRLGHPRILFLIAALAGLPAASEASQFDYLDLSVLSGGTLSYAGDTYYSAKPHIWVSSSDGETYDGYQADELAFKLDADFEYTTGLGFQEVTQKVRFKGSGYDEEEFYLSKDPHVYTTGYLPPATEYTPIELCNMEKSNHGPNAMKTGFVLVRQNAYEIHGWIRYRNEWSQTKTVSDTVHSDVYILCAGDGKPLGPGGGTQPAPTREPPPPPPPNSANDLSFGFAITEAHVAIAPAYDPLTTTNCPVTVPIVLSFQGTEPKSFEYKVTAANGGLSKTLSGKLKGGAGGPYTATREIQILVPEAPPKGTVAHQASGDLLPGGGGGPPPPQGPGSMQSASGGGGGVPPAGPAVIKQDTEPGSYAASFRIEVVSPNHYVSDYAGYHILCKQAPLTASPMIMMKPKPQLPPPPQRGLAANPVQPPPQPIGRLATPGTPPPPPVAGKLALPSPPPTPPPGAKKLATAPPQRAKMMVLNAGPRLVLGSDKKNAGQNLVIRSGQAQPARNAGQCRVDGLKVEWPGEAPPSRGVARANAFSVRLGAKKVRPTRIVPGAVTVLVLPALEMPHGLSSLQVGHEAKTASWNLDVQADCGARTPMRLRNAGDPRKGGPSRTR
jgi:hypothetical protein